MPSTNQIKLLAAVARWKAEAADYPADRAAELLVKKAELIAGDIAHLANCLANGIPAGGHLAGLSVFDLADARDALFAAAGPQAARAA